MSSPPDSRADSLFPATSWTAIRNAQDPSAPEYARHLQRLIELYWRPVYWVIRRAWRRTPEEAADLTQEFFTRHVVARPLVRAVSPDRGSFRSLVRAAIRNFMLSAARDAARAKRGGQFEIFTMDPGELEGLDAVESEHASPEALFDAAWNRTVLARAVDLMRTRLLADGRAAHFSVFQRYELDEGGERPSYADVGAALGLSVPQVKHALIEARVTFKEAVTDVVREYVDSPEDLEQELKSLFG